MEKTLISIDFNDKIYLYAQTSVYDQYDCDCDCDCQCQSECHYFSEMNRNNAVHEVMCSLNEKDQSFASNCIQGHCDCACVSHCT